MKNFKKQIISLAILATLTIPVLGSANYCQAASITEAMKGALQTVTLPSGGENPETTALTIVGKVIAAFLSLFGIIFLILIIFGGYKWMLASGREDEVKKAQEIIRNAVIGLIIVLASYAITYFITTSLELAVK
ncbi:MAG: hypothetical protein WC508_04345 [Patescibacteria group bacterium]